MNDTQEQPPHCRARRSLKEGGKLLSCAFKRKHVILLFSEHKHCLFNLPDERQPCYVTLLTFTDDLY